MTTHAVAETPSLPVPPAPASMEDRARAEHSRLRRRLLYGRWDDDLRQIVVQASGTRRADAWRMVDVSANLFRSSMAQLAVQYDRRPYVLHGDEAGTALVQRIAEGRYWETMRRAQRDTLGQRETLIRVDLEPDGGALREAGPRFLFRQVFADLVTAASDPRDPSRPIQLTETALRDLPDGSGVQWTREVWDVRPGQEPRVRVEDAQGVDVSPVYLRDASGQPAPKGGLAGERYGWRVGGKPFIPYVVHHAEHTADLWDPYEGRELVAGALNVALMWSFWGHIVRNAAWSQRYAINAEPVGAGDVRGEHEASRRVVVGDPGVLWLFKAHDPADGQPVLGTLEQPADPQAVADAILLYERRIAAFAGISPSDVQRIAGDPRSGFALEISRTGLREAQQQREATFRAGDLEVLAVAAALWSAGGYGAAPLGGYSIEYQTLPETTDELRARQEVILSQLDRGLVDKVTAYQRLNPGVSTKDAADELDRIAAVNALYTASREDQPTAGAQAESLADLVERVSTGRLPGASAAAILRRSYGLSEAEARELLAPAEAQALAEPSNPAPPTVAPPAPGA